MVCVCVCVCSPRVAITRLPFAVVSLSASADGGLDTRQTPRCVRRAVRAPPTDPAEPLVHGDLVGGEYGCDKGQTTHADEPLGRGSSPPTAVAGTSRPAPAGQKHRYETGPTATADDDNDGAAVPVRATGGMTAAPVRSSAQAHTRY